MCIAIIKPAGVPVPSDAIFKKSFEDNSDGAGMAFNVGKKYVIKKGIKTYAEFDKLLKHMTKTHSEEWMKATAMAFHFRIGTHGSRDDPKHTHPFPVSDKVEHLEKLELRCDRIVMHNGIMSSWGSSHWNNRGKADSSLSDTMEFIKDFVHPLTKMLSGKTIYDSEEAQMLISREVAGSRFVIMEGNGTILTWGDWITHEGCYYSNRGFEPRKTYEYKAPVYVNTAADKKWYMDDDDYDDNAEYWRNWHKMQVKEKSSETGVIQYVNGTVGLESVEIQKKTSKSGVLESKFLVAEYTKAGFKQHFFQAQAKIFPLYFAKDKKYYRVWAAGTAYPMTSNDTPAIPKLNEVEFGVT